MTERKLTLAEKRATRPSRTGSVAESLRLQDALRAGRAQVVDGRVVEESYESEDDK